MAQFGSGFHGPEAWYWGSVILGVAAWLVSLRAIFRSSKFRTKWLWILLSMVHFSYAFGGAFVIQIPVGALCVLGFQLFGPRPVRRAPGQLTP